MKSAKGNPTVLSNGTRIYIYVALLLLFGFHPAATFAQHLPERPNPPHLVNDLAGLMSPQEVATLEQKLDGYNDSTSNQIAVVTVNNLDGDDESDFAFKLAKAWRIGEKGKNNGILILVAKAEHKVFIATGYGMEDVVPDAYCKRIETQKMVPNFKDGNYYKGLDEGTDVLFGLLTGKFKADDVKQKPTHIPLKAIMILIFIVFYIILSIFRGNRGQTIGGGGIGNMGTMWMIGSLLGGLGGGRGGDGDSGGGGFGGFGGGDFGGGGAGSSW